jgi:hypothetical protein
MMPRASEHTDRDGRLKTAARESSVMGCADPALPQLATLWNADAMLDVLRSSLVDSSGADVELRSCAIRRVRYRPGARSIVLYELDAGEPLHVTAITYADDRAAQQYNRIRQSLADESASGLPPYAHLEGLRALVQVYPYDRQLPSLPRVAAGTDRETLKILDEACGGGETDWDITGARYRPMQGCTFRYRGGDPVRDLYVKVYRNEQEGRDAYATLRNLHETVREARPGFHVVRPVGFCEASRTLTVESADGTAMPELLAGGGDPAELGQRSARALRAFHESRFACTTCWGPRHINERAEQAAALITIACPELTDAINRIAETLRDYPSDFTARPSQLDPKPDHFFFEDEQVSFIDLDTFAAADPMFDAAFMFARMRALPDSDPSIAAESAAAAADAFLERYLTLTSPGDAQRLAINHVYALLQLALYAVRHQDHGWRDLATARANAALAECERVRRN